MIILSLSRVIRLINVKAMVNREGEKKTLMSKYEVRAYDIVGQK